jgi:hypothetical protein
MLTGLPFLLAQLDLGADVVGPDMVHVWLAIGLLVIVALVAIVGWRLTKRWIFDRRDAMKQFTWKVAGRVYTCPDDWLVARVRVHAQDGKGPYEAYRAALRDWEEQDNPPHQ